MKISKKIFIVPTVALIILTAFVMLLLLVPRVPGFMITYVSQWQYAVDFDEYGDDFKAVAEYCREFFEGHSEGYIGYNYGYYLSYDGERISLPSDVNKSVQKIAYAFDNEGYLDSIRYHENRISFQISNGQYALVYSFDDKKPAFVNSPEEKWSISVRKIEDNWYHAAKNLFSS